MLLFHIEAKAMRMGFMCEKQLSRKIKRIMRGKAKEKENF